MTNLITQQQGSIGGPATLVRFNSETGEFEADGYGRVSSTPRGRAHRNSSGRPCIHCLEVPAPCAIFGAEWVHKILWQPCLYSYTTPSAGQTASKVIAARRGSIVTVGFDCVGPTLGCHHTPTRIEADKVWTYRLMPMQFDDEDTPSERFYLGVWPD